MALTPPLPLSDHATKKITFLRLPQGIPYLFFNSECPVIRGESELHTYVHMQKLDPLVGFIKIN